MTDQWLNCIIFLLTLFCSIVPSKSVISNREKRKERNPRVRFHCASFSCIWPYHATKLVARALSNTIAKQEHTSRMWDIDGGNTSNWYTYIKLWSCLSSLLAFLNWESGFEISVVITASNIVIKINSVILVKFL